MRKKNIWYALVALSLTVTSCKEKDLFEPEKYEDDLEEAFPVDNVDKQHTWSTVKSAEVTVQVDRNLYQTFAVRVYDKNPVNDNSSLSLLGQGTVQGGGVCTMKINLQQAQKEIFVALIDSCNYMTVYPQVVTTNWTSIRIGDNGSDPLPIAVPASRAAVSAYKFPGDADANLFLDEVPAGVRSYADECIANGQTDGYPSGISYVDASWQGQVNVWGSWDGTMITGGTLYIQGDNDFTSRRFYVSGNSQIFLLRGATLRLSADNAAQLQAGCHVYIAEDARIITSGNVSLKDGFQLFNHGTVEVGKLTVGAASLLYNSATLNLSGELTAGGGNAVVVNDGTLSATRLHLTGEGQVQNNNVALISGNTDVDSSGNTWVNNAQYTTTNFNVTAGGNDLADRCALTVDETFKVSLSEADKNSFAVDAGASVVAKYMELSGPARINMGSRSLFHVTKSAYMAVCKDTYGIYGPSDGYPAIFQAQQIMRSSSIDASTPYVVGYYNHLYVATDSHFDFIYSEKTSNKPSYRLQAESGAAITPYLGANVHTTGYTCGAFYDGVPLTEEPAAQPFSLLYCFEDNFPEWGDFDYNDVVIRVIPVIEGTKVTLEVNIDAVGTSKAVAAAIRFAGIKSSDIVESRRIGNFDNGYPTTAKVIINEDDRYNSNVFVPIDKKCNAYLTDAVVKLFNNAHWAILPQLTSTGAIQNWYYNTVSRTGNSKLSYLNDVAPRSITYVFETKDEATARKFVKENLDVFIVEPYGAGFWEVHTLPWKTIEVFSEYANGNKATYDSVYPWAFCLPGDSFLYPREGTKITTAYQYVEHSFKEWAQNRNKATDWYLYPVEKAVYEKVVKE